MTSSPDAAMEEKFEASMRLMRSRSTDSPTRTLMARCSIHALLRPGLYALMRLSVPLSVTSACSYSSKFDVGEQTYLAIPTVARIRYMNRNEHIQHM